MDDYNIVLITDFDIETVRDVFRRCLVTDVPTCVCCPYKDFNTNEADCSCLKYLYGDVDRFLSELLDDYITKNKI